MWVSCLIEDLVGMWVRIANFFAREQLSAGFRFAPVAAPIGFPACGYVDG
jgi:hypothetical protein